MHLVRDRNQGNGAGSDSHPANHSIQPAAAVGFSVDQRRHVSGDAGHHGIRGDGAATPKVKTEPRLWSQSRS